ncbi:MAG: hypothetical protein H6727_02550 [Myxococcales bacterium]|nr:hypothetical protein [Myxococcales bacterium]
MFYIRLLCLFCLLWFPAQALAAAPLRQLTEKVDNLDPKAMSEVERYLQDSSLTAQERAQLLQLKSLIHLNNVRTVEARALFEQALKSDPKVPLLGNLSPNNRAKYEAWRKDFLQRHLLRRPPPRRVIPPQDHRLTGRIAYGVLLGLGGAALITGAITSGMAAGQIDAYNKLQGIQDPETTRKKAEIHAEAKTMETISIASFVGGGVLVIAGVIVAVLTETAKPPPPPPTETSHSKNETHSLLFRSF